MVTTEIIYNPDLANNFTSKAPAYIPNSPPFSSRTPDENVSFIPLRSTKISFKSIYRPELIKVSIRNMVMIKIKDQISSFSLFPTVALFSFSSCCFLYFVFLFVLPFGLPGFLFVCAIIVTLPHKYRVHYNDGSQSPSVKGKIMQFFI